MIDTERAEKIGTRTNVVEMDRTKGAVALSIDVTGDRKSIWTATGLIASGGTEVVYLTFTRAVGGERSINKMPLSVSLWQNEVDEALARAGSPLDPTRSMRLKEPVATTKVLAWMPANKVWAVEVTNNDTTAHAYAIAVEGF